MNLLIALLICIIPLVVAILFARIFNIVMGLFMYPFTCFAWMFACGKVEALAKLSVVDGKDYTAFNNGVVNFIHKYTFDKLSFLQDLSATPWIILGVWVLLFIILFGISCGIKKSRKRRMQNKYSNVRVVQPRY